MFNYEVKHLISTKRISRIGCQNWESRVVFYEPVCIRKTLYIKYGEHEILKVFSKPN